MAYGSRGHDGQPEQWDRSERVRYCLVDAFTKFVYLHYTRKIDSFSTVKAFSTLKSAIFLFGSPCRIIADQGRCFTGKEFQDFCQGKRIELHLIVRWYGP